MGVVTVVLVVVGTVAVAVLACSISRHAEGVLELVVQDELHGDNQAHMHEARPQPTREPRRAQLRERAPG